MDEIAAQRKKERLAKQLRANLLRRKAQARERRDGHEQEQIADEHQETADLHK